MSDFLTSMLDRAAGRAVTLQPRRPSVFEPVAPSRVQESSIHSEWSGEEAGAEQPVRHLDRAPTAVARTDDDQARPVITPRPQTLLRTAVPAPETKAARVAGREIPENPHVSKERPAADVPPNPVGETVHTETIETVFHTREIVREVVAPLERLEERKTPASPTSVAAPSRVASVTPQPVVPRAALPKLVAEPVRSPRAVEGSPTLIPKAPVPQIRRALAERPPNRVAARTPQISRTQETRVEAPVRVTIGSIEFRSAATPSSAPQKTRIVGPKLKLDDYLESRRGGQR